MLTEEAFSFGARWHVVGVGGAGMSGVARVLAQMGCVVSGSDARHSATTDALVDEGITVAIGHDARAVPARAFVIASPAVASENVELVAARERGCTVVRRGELLAALVGRRTTWAIAGTHGKTTTSTMLALIADAAGRDPSYLIGEAVAGLGSNARWAGGDCLVVEADESYGTFASMAPAVLGITNVEADHLDHYGDLDTLIGAFADLGRRSGQVVVFSDDALAATVGEACGALRVGTDAAADFVVGALELGLGRSSFTLTPPAGATLPLEVAASGQHNVANAAVAAAVAMLAGVDSEAIARGLAGFAGVPRRFELRGARGGVTFIDDYAHLPTEVAATVHAALASTEDRLVVVFQPHRYTRTAAVGAEFATSFVGVDHLVVADLYSAGEPPIPGVSSAIVVDAVRASGTVPHVDAVDDAHLDDHVAGLLRPGTVLLTMGAGDLTELPTRLLARMAAS